MFLNIGRGQIVFSKAGRDSGKMFIVTEAVDTNHVLIADGDLRKIEKPKKKKIKHLEATGVFIEHIADKLMRGLKVTNSEIRKALADIYIERQQGNRLQ
jgi:large subunit ribosomal protein L14e